MSLWQKLHEVFHSIAYARATRTRRGSHGSLGRRVALELLEDRRLLAVGPVDELDGGEMGITICESAGLVTTEAGGTASFTVVLDSKPSAEVTIGLSSSDISEGRIWLDSLTFNAQNWDLPQRVAVTGMDDDVDDGDVVYTILTAGAISEDESYNGFDAEDVAITNEDDDTAGITVGLPINSHGMFPGEMSDVGGTYVDDIVLGDFDEDGLLDAACTRREEGVFSLLLGRGDGSFEDHIDNQVGKRIHAIATADFDQDGHADLVVGDRLVIGRGDGTFEPWKDILSGDIFELATKDIDKDGFVDIIAIDLGGAVTLLPGRGDGTFDSGISLDVGDGSRAVAIGDLDGDGHLDLAIANGPANDVSVIFGEGGWQFRPQETHTVGTYPYNLAMADLDQDGRLDLLVANGLSADISVLYGDGDGGFQPEVRHASGDYPSDLVVTDVNQDGRPDILVATSHSPYLTVLLGQADGSLVDGGRCPTGTYPRTMALGDTNNDGHEDLTIACWVPGTVTVHLRNEDGAFQFSAYQEMDAWTEGVSLADFNSDGHLDMATVDTRPEGGVLVRLGRGDGTFETETLYAVAATSNWPIVGDFNEDGSLDMLVSNRLGKHALLLGRIDGTFEVTSTNTGVAFGGSPIADFDGDGHLDLFCMNSRTTDPWYGIQRGKGDGTFHPVSKVHLSSEYTYGPCARSADFNGDGIPDIVGGAFDHQIQVFIGVGDGTFREPVSYLEDISVGTLAVADFDEDGSPDILIFQSDSTTLLRNRGDGTFTTHRLLTHDPNSRKNTRAYSVVSDINSDGHADVATFVYGFHCVWLLLGNGDGTFAESATYAPGTFTSVPFGPFSAADLNGDGLDDLMLPDEWAGGMPVLLQNEPSLEFVTSEEGAETCFTIRLDSEPAENVTIDLSSGNINEGTVTPATVTFTPENWNTSQTVTMIGVDDVMDDGDIAYTIVAEVSSSDSVYDKRDVADIMVTNVDDDAIGITVGGVSGLTTGETGGAASFTVVLDHEPTDDVTVWLSSSDMTEGHAVPSFLRFTADNWSQSREVTVTGRNDDVDDGDVAYTIAVTAFSDDAFYDGLYVTDVSLTNLDDDAAEIVVTPSSGLVTDESGLIAEFTIVLGSEPTTDVVLDLTSGNLAEGTISASQLVFNAENWDESQTVTVAGVDDDVDDGDAEFAIHVQVDSEDPQYRELDVDDVTVTNVDDDTAGVSLRPESLDASGMFPGEMFDVGRSPDDMTMADFNEDGHPDIACTNRMDGFSVLLGRGDGTFEDRVTYDVRWEANALASGDMDGDGHVDVVVGGYLYRGTRDGSFASPVEVPFLGARDVAIADVDGDGALDVIRVNFGDHVYLIPGRGDGTFESESRFEVGDGAKAISVTDLNGDGHLDLMVACREYVSVLLGQGNRAFASQEIYIVGDYPTSLEAADVNQDNLVDLIVADYHEPGVSILLGVGDGSFQSAIQYRLGEYPNATLTYDVDRDGKLDLLVADSGSSCVHVLHGNGDGTFVKGEALPTGGASYAFALADYNADGCDDLGVLSRGAGTFVVHLGVTDGTFQSGTYWRMKAPPRGLVLVDLNDDGHLDMATSSGAYPTVSVRLGLGDGRFADASRYTVTESSGSLVAGDFNEDGVIDLMVASGNHFTRSVLFGCGDGTFEVTIYEMEKSLGSLTVADFDGDGHLDLLSLERAASGLDVGFSIYLGAGDGSFHFAHEVPLAAREYVREPTPVAVAFDFNADGIVDLAMGPSAGEILVFLGEGDGTFGEPYRYEEDIVRGSLSQADFNEDGHTDLVGTRYLGSFVNRTSEIVLLLNQGDGAFVPRVLSGYEGSVTASMVVDVNGDGHADLMSSGGAARVLLGDGNGMFAAPVQYASGFAYGATAAGDLNEDGRVDLVAWGGEYDVSVLLQNPGEVLKTVGEEGTIRYSVILDSKPAEDVTVTVVSDNETEGTVWPESLVFTSEDWDQPKGFTVTFLDDDVDDGDVDFAVLANVTSGDSLYDGFDMWGLTVTNRDDGDTAGISVSPATGLTTSETGTSATFTVVLESEPTADVTIGVASSDMAEGTVLGSSLLFTPANWDQPQAVTVLGVDDVLDDYDVAYAIVTAAAVSDDVNYNGLDAEDVLITNEDDEEFTSVDLGSVDFARLDSVGPLSDVLWFRLETARDGWLTVQAVDERTADELTFRLFEPNNLASPVATSTVRGGKPRFDYGVQQGQTLRLQVTGTTSDASLLVANLVYEDGAAITVHGTAEADVFVFDAGTSRSITINGVGYHYEDTEVSTVDFTGGDGRDTAWLYDSSGDESLEAWPDRASFMNGAGDGEADFTVQVSGIEDLLGYATRGGTDSAVFHGSLDADKLKSYDDSVRLRAKDSSYTIRGKRFDTIASDSGAGGKDLAVFNGTDGDETFTYLGADNLSRIEGDEREHTATGFELVVARAGRGGNDVAHFTDIPGATDRVDDVFYFKGHKTQLVGADVKITVRAFDQVYANASESGYDVARIYDAAGDERLEVEGDTARLYRYSDDELVLMYEAVAFERVKAYRSGSNDTKSVEDHSFELYLYGWDG